MWIEMNGLGVDYKPNLTDATFGYIGVEPLQIASGRPCSACWQQRTGWMGSLAAGAGQAGSAATAAAWWGTKRHQSFTFCSVVYCSCPVMSSPCGGLHHGCKSVQA